MVVAPANISPESAHGTSVGSCSVENIIGGVQPMREPSTLVSGVQLNAAEIVPQTTTLRSELPVAQPNQEVRHFS
jgi:hypothetical protein